MDKRHKGYNRRDARQPLTALTALGLGQTMFGLSAYPSRLVELASLFLRPSRDCQRQRHARHQQVE
jgi:hypothetical protein